MEEDTIITLAVEEAPNSRRKVRSTHNMFAEKEHYTKHEQDSFSESSSFLENGKCGNERGTLDAWYQEVGTLTGDWKCCKTCGSSEIFDLEMISIAWICLTLVVRFCTEVQYILFYK